MHKFFRSLQFLVLMVSSAPVFAALTLVSDNTPYLSVSPPVVSISTYPGVVVVRCSIPMEIPNYGFCRFKFGDGTVPIYGISSKNYSHTLVGGAAIYKISVDYCVYNTESANFYNGISHCRSDANPSIGSIKVITGPSATGSTAYSGQLIKVGNRITSEDGRFFLQYQTDNNLVLYRSSDYRALWASNTVNVNRVGLAVMQTDGNLVLYDTNMQPTWASNTAGNSSARLLVQTDGNLVIYRPDDKPIWASNTCCQ